MEKQSGLQLMFWKGKFQVIVVLMHASVSTDCVIKSFKGYSVSSQYIAMFPYLSAKYLLILSSWFDLFEFIL